MSSFTFTEVVRLAQVGVSGWGRNLLSSLASLPSAELVVACDADETELSIVNRLAPKTRATSRIETVLADSSVDAVVIAAGENTTALALDCLNAGKHVFVQAPFAETPENAQRLLSLASSSDLRLMAGHVLRYHPAIRTLQQQIEDGALGSVRTLSWRLGGLNARLGTSVLRQLGASALSVTRALIPEAPVAITAHGQAYTSDGSWDVVLLTLEFGSGGLAHLYLSRVDALKTRQLTVVGSKGLAVFDDMDPSTLLQILSKDASPEDSAPVDYAQAVRTRWGPIHVPLVSTTEPLSLECREFVAAIRERRAPLTDGADGLAVLQLMDAAERSLRSASARVELA